MSASRKKRTPFAKYKESERITLDELAKRLGLKSRGHASDLVNGNELPSKRTAQRMGELTGKPWWKFLDASPTREARP